MFTVKNPSFLRHLWNLGKELIPFYRIKNLFPARGKLYAEQKQDALAKCPSAPTVYTSSAPRRRRATCLTDRLRPDRA